VMSQEKVDAIRAVYERWSEGDFRASVELLDPHVVLVHEPEFEAGGAVYGLEAVLAYTRTMLEPWTSFTQTAEELVGAGDSVLVGVYQRGVGKTSGVPTELRYFMLWTFR